MSLPHLVVAAVALLVGFASDRIANRMDGMPLIKWLCAKAIPFVCVLAIIRNLFKAFIPVE